MTDHPTDGADDRADRDDELLRRSLRDEAGGIHPVPDWDDVRDRAGSSPRWWLPTAAGILVVALVAAAFLVLRDDDGGDTGVIADDPGRSTVPDDTTTSTAPETTTSTTTVTGAMEAGPDVDPLDLPAGEPLADGEVVVATVIPGVEFAEMEIVVLSEETGEVLRTLADGYDTVEGGVYGLTLTPDRRTLLYVVSTAACSARVEATAVDGSSDAVVVADDGGAVAPSPDGSQLAIASGDSCIGPPTVDLVPVGGGQVTRYPGVGAGDHDGIESMAFTDDGSLLLTTVVNAPDADPELFSLELSSGLSTVVDQAPVRYRSLMRAADGVTAVQEQEIHGAAFLVGLDGDPIAGRRALDVDGEVGTATVVDSGAVAVVEPAEQRLTIDGRLVREGVTDVAG